MAARRVLHEAEESRPGRSDLAYMQHKFSPLDSRIIIITAAILLLLITILFLNFFIRWVLRRFFLFHSPKPTNLNKGLSKRQVQALPSFVYSSSKPFFPTHIPSVPCGHTTFYPPFIPHPLSSHLCHVLFPTSMASTKIDDIGHQYSTKLEGCKGGQNAPSQVFADQVHKDTKDQTNNSGSLEGDRVNSTHVNAVDNQDPSEFGSLKEVDHAVEIGLSITNTEKVVSNTGCNEAIRHVGDKDVKLGNSIVDCKKNDEVDKAVDDSSSSTSPCPICLVEFMDGETIRVLPACRHYFHVGCIDLWLTKSSSCPACRANLLETTKAPTKESTPHVQLPFDLSQ